MTVYRILVIMELVLMPSMITFALAIQDGMEKNAIIVKLYNVSRSPNSHLVFYALFKNIKHEDPIKSMILFVFQ